MLFRSRKPVAAWLVRMQAAAVTPNSGAPGAADGNFGPSSDWLLALIAQITSEAHPGVGDELRLSEDLHLDSLGRVQLSAAIEERLGIVEGTGLLEDVRTLGELRKLVAGASADGASQPSGQTSSAPPLRDPGWEQGSESAGTEGPGTKGPGTREPGAAIPAAPRVHFVYPEWPWWKPFQWMRVAFLEVVQRPLTRLLAAPRVVGTEKPLPPGPLLIVGNHVTAYDGPLIQYGLPGPLRRHIAVAMAGNMLNDYRHWRNPEWPPEHKGIWLFGPPAYWLVTAFYNVFPLARQRDFQLSFAHAGKAMDHGYSVMVFPEGARSEGQLARFRPGIGLLVKQSGVPVVPTAIRGLGEMRAGRRRWFRSGHLEVRVGEAIRFSPEESEAAITARLHDEVERLLGEEEAS